MNSLVPSPQLLQHKPWGADVRSLQSNLFWDETGLVPQPLFTWQVQHHDSSLLNSFQFIDVFPMLMWPKQATVSKCALMSVEGDNPFSWFTNCTHLKRAQGAVRHLCCQNTVGSCLPAIYKIFTFSLDTVAPHSQSPVLLLFQMQDFTFGPVLVSARTELIFLQ